MSFLSSNSNNVPFDLFSLWSEQQKTERRRLRTLAMLSAATTRAARPDPVARRPRRRPRAAVWRAPR